MTRFGQTLFGGAIAGLVIAAGTANCAAQASGHNEVTRHVTSSASAKAVGSADVRRKAGAFPCPVACVALAQGASQVDFRPLPVEIQGTALGSGRAQVDFFVYSFANAYGQMTGKPVRRVKLFPKQAQALAYGSADVQTWQLGYPAPARATARGFGTTYYVGNGPGFAYAYGSADPSFEVGGQGRAIAVSGAEATCLYTGGVAGLGLARAETLVDAIVTRNGVREFEMVGLGLAQADAYAGTVGITQAQRATARASIQATAKAAIGGKGKGTARATGIGDGVGMATGAAAVPGDAATTAVGKAVYLARAVGTGSAKATGQGSAQTKQTRVQAKAAAGKTTAQGNALRTVQVSSKAGATANTSANSRRTKSIKNQTVNATASVRMTSLGVAVKAAIAAGTATAQGRGYTRFSAKPMQASAYATGEGFNQVNDLVRAPLSRTIMAETEPRLVVIPTEPRLIQV